MRALLAATAMLLLATGCSTQRPIHVPQQASAAVRIETAMGLGSGVYIGNGIVLTAAHVVHGDRVVRLISDVGDIQDGEVLWTNAAYDIAAVRPANARRFAEAYLDCRAVVVGEAITARGEPVGIRDITMHGYVSGEPRALEPKWKNAFVTDMTVISGMSGGGVSDAYGNIVGINVGAMDPHGAEGEAAAGGLAFAVPSSVVCALLGRV